MSIDLKRIKEICREHWDNKDRSGPRNFVPVSNTLAVKMARRSWGEEDLKYEHAWLEYMASNADSKRVVVPKPHGPVITHGDLNLLLMDFIHGDSIAMHLKDGHVLDKEVADKICDAYLALREIPPQPDKLCPTGWWPIRGRIFTPDNDGGLILESPLAFSEYMDDRLMQAHDGKTTALPQTEVVFNYGDLSPNSIIQLPDGRISIVDLGMALWGPTYWDLYALIICPYKEEFAAPMKKAFARRGLMIDPTTEEMLWKFTVWHFHLGNAVARAQVRREKRV
ncbi:kinase-like domain-containing protein [Crucibulum laeve]|uniref:Kinase-like domain-containing protein n=1 Tax=Crucibulum laeve TaxID=68775 RepID=A0A5C3MRL2_9AGAR|nr:kinase-like domain-containing protein [Crucibulum laeve]